MSSSFRAASVLRPAGGAPAFVPDPPSWWKVALALAGALLVQSTLEPYVAVHGAVVSWVLLIVVWYGLRAGFGRGLLFGLIAGACEDALGPATAPAWTFATALVGALAGRTAGTFAGESRAWLAPLVLLATLIRFAAFTLIEQLGRTAPSLSAAQAHAILWQAALNALVALGLALVFQRLGSARATHP